MSAVLDRLRRYQTVVSVAVLALLAYVPALTAAPGRMPADSKLYVYLDPGRFISDTTTTFDPRQFAGWVPHQHIAYLWPTGPWYWLFEQIGLPDWVAHRLWIGTLLVVAGLGVRWMCGRLGFAPLAALVAALVYQLSPYVLPYISRTSVLLLPFAGLGWIVGCTILAARRGRWRHAALVALIVLTVGAVNATALAMVVPAPVLWLVHAAWSGSITWRRAVVTAAKIGAASIAVSLWWIAMLVIQGRYGADVLAYSESLESVSFTSTSTEVGRGLGYWLFYVRDGFAATTTASLDHLVSVRVIAAGFLLGAVCLLGVVAVRTPHRRFAGLLVAVGVVLGVGVHPIDDPSPLMDVLVADSQGGLALALRSSTRAVPVLLLGLAIGAASLVSASGQLARVRPFRRWGVSPVGARLAVGALVVVLAIVNLPALRNGGFVDPALERDQDPPVHWVEATAALDERSDGYRVLQVPGTEFGAFAWGYTVDQPLPGMTERPLVTRDLLPLGSAAAMDLAFALDDRIQEGTLETASLAPVARLLGVDVVWISGDVSFDRFGLARPDVLTALLSSTDAVDDDLAVSASYGPVAPVSTRIPVIDAESLGEPAAGQPIAPITLLDVIDPVPTVRVKDRTVAVYGSGDGLVDAAAAGLLDGTEAVVYGAEIDAVVEHDVPVSRVIVTDSNRRRAHHWRSSQDVHGYTESAEGGVLRLEPADQRLPVFGDEPDIDDQTVSIQEGTVTARASAYGEPFAYRPEHRPVMAIDGDPGTAWLVADRAPAVGEFIELTVDGGLDHLDLRQPDSLPGTRTITRVLVTVGDAAPFPVDLTDDSLRGGGQRVPLDPTVARPVDAGGPVAVRITIDATSDPQPPIAEAIGAVGFAEIGTGHEPTVEWIRPSTADAAVTNGDDTALDLVFSRLRTEPTDRWRDDPEPVLRRQFELVDALDGSLAVTMRFDRRSSGSVLALLLDEPVEDDAHLTGVPLARGAAAFDGDAASAWTTPFLTPVGSALTFRGDGTASTVSIDQPEGTYSTVTGLRLVDAAGPLDVAVARGTTDVTLPRPVALDELRIEITAVEPSYTVDRRYAEPFLLPSAISEIRFDGASPLVTPVDTIRFTCRDDLLTVDGVGIPLTFEMPTEQFLRGDAIAAEPCDADNGVDTGVDGAANGEADIAVSLEPGEHRIASTSSSDTGVDVDRIVIRQRDEVVAGGLDVTAPVLDDSSRRSRSIEVPTCPTGCWVIVGEGHNGAWSASVDGDDLGTPVLLDGNANGWWLSPSDAGRRVEVRWTAQRPLSIALGLSALATIVLVGLVVWDRRRDDDERAERVVAEFDLSTRQRADRRTAVSWTVVSAVLGALLVDWLWGALVGLVVAGAFAVRRPRLVGLVGVSVVLTAGTIVTAVVRRERPFPNAGWPIRFEWLHTWSLFGFLLVGLATLISERRGTGSSPADPDR